MWGWARRGRAHVLLEAFLHTDYSIADMIDISENDISPLCIAVNVTDDDIVELNETFQIQYSGDNVTATIATNVTIIDNDEGNCE